MKVKDDPHITGRWSKYNTALLEDWEVLFSAGEGDYQGNCEFIAWDTSSYQPEYVMVDWGWGSCSGCDGYEDMAEGERIKAFMNQREYFSEASLTAWLANFETVNSGVLKVNYLAGLADPYDNALLRVNAIRHALDMPAWHP